MYAEAGRVLGEVLTQKKGLKSAALAPSVRNKRATYAVVCQTLKFKPVIDEVLDIAAVPKLAKKAKVSQYVLYVMLHDLLFGKGVRGGGFAKKTLTGFKEPLWAALERLKIRRKVARVEDLLAPSLRQQVSLPRYARVNTLKLSVDDAVRQLSKDIPAVQRDAHVASVLAFPAGTDLHAHPLVTAGALILQDKASCFPAAALLAGFTLSADDMLLDACAAPGNKTSHLAALHPRGTVFAFDKSPGRLRTLKARMKAAAADNVQAVQQDFLSVDTGAEQYQHVKAVLVDPSCSGSGMVSRLDHFLTNKTEADAAPQQRLAALTAFQAAAVSHAFTFPSARRVSYSTCSIHNEENEGVVAAVLPEAKKHGFQLVRALPAWPRRGRAVCGLSPADAHAVVRVDPSKDQTNGFFVAVFERTGSGAAEAGADADAVDAGVLGASSAGAGAGAGALGRPTASVPSPPARKRRRPPPTTVSLIHVYKRAMAM